jgi:hypothetical protein
VVTPPPNVPLVHGQFTSLSLGANFIDDDGDIITMTATYSFNGGPAASIPGGIFSVPSAFTIDATSVGLADVGSYLISLSISDSLSTITSSFTLTITNASPRLVTTLLDVTAPQNQNTPIDLSTYFVDDDGDTITMTATYSFNGGAATAIPGGIFSVPSPFVVNANPTSPTQVGTYTISVTVSDSALSITNTFIVTVANTPPRFTSTMPDRVVNLNGVGTYDLSTFFVDDDGNALTMSATSSFAGAAAASIPVGIITLVNWSTIEISPVLVGDLGSYVISVTISDSLATISTSFTISVVNTPPYFVSEIPKDFIMKFNNTFTYSIPFFQDDEGHAVTIILDSVPSG